MVDGKTSGDPAALSSACSSRPALFALGLAAALAFPAVSRAVAADPVEIAWQQDCREDPATHRVCLDLSAPGVPSLHKLTTLMVDTGDGSELRHIVVRKPEPHLALLAAVAPEQVCHDKRAHPDSFCGEQGIAFEPSDCPKFEERKACRLRAVPFDNPSFPHFPDPMVAETYFQPAAVYQTKGDTSGDVDKYFFRLARRRSSADPDLLPAPAQRQVEILAWQWFLHVNWPTRHSVRADPDALDGRYCPLWALWRQADDLKTRDGAYPIPWGAPKDPANAPCTIPTNLYLSSAVGHPRVAINNDPNDAEPDLGRLHDRQASDDILHDRTGAPVLYEVRVNRPLYDAVVAGALQTEAGMRRIMRPGRKDRAVDLPLGQFFFAATGSAAMQGIAKSPGERSAGAIALKLAWKVLTREEWEAERKAPRFVTARATVDPRSLTTVEAEIRRHVAVATSAPRLESLTEPPEGPDRETGNDAATVLLERYRAALPWAKNDEGRGPLVFHSEAEDSGDSRRNGSLFACEGTRCRVALVGMHIAQKTDSGQFWNWSTFAHRDNLRGATSLFANEDCDRIGAGRSETRWMDSKGIAVTHICPLPQQTASTRLLNDEIAAVLARLPVDNNLRRLANYELIGTQWVRPAKLLAPPEGDSGSPRRRPLPISDDIDAAHAMPAHLANPVLETFDLGKSCFDCHKHAKYGFDDDTEVRTDLMFFLSNGKRPR